MLITSFPVSIISIRAKSTSSENEIHMFGAWNWPKCSGKKLLTCCYLCRSLSLSLTLANYSIEVTLNYDVTQWFNFCSLIRLSRRGIAFGCFLSLSLSLSVCVCVFWYVSFTLRTHLHPYKNLRPKFLAKMCLVVFRIRVFFRSCRRPFALLILTLHNRY